MEESSHQHCSFEQYTEADVPLPGILLRTVQSVPRMPRRVPSSVLGVGSRTTKCKDLTVSVCHPWDSLVLPEGWRAELNSPAQHCAPALPQRHPWDAFLPPPSPLRPSKSPTRAHHPRKRNPPSQAGVAADQVAPAMHQFSQRAARCAQRRQIRWLICLQPLEVALQPPFTSRSGCRPSRSRSAPGCSASCALRAAAADAMADLPAAAQPPEVALQPPFASRSGCRPSRSRSARG